MKLRHPASWIVASATTFLVAIHPAAASDTQDAGKAASSGANWPMFRGNPALTGVASGSLDSLKDDVEGKEGGAFVR